MTETVKLNSTGTGRDLTQPTAVDKPVKSRSDSPGIDRPFRGMDDANPKDLHGIKKPPVDLVPATGIIHEAMAFKNGAIKYGPFNWRSKKVKAMIYLGACLRHIWLLINGEDFEIDPKTGVKVHHAGAARACLNIFLDAQETGNLIDDRPVPAPIAAVIERLTDK